MTEAKPLFSVDRREGKLFVLINEDGTSFDVKFDDLPGECRHEGAIIRVPVDNSGNHLWKSAVRDVEQEKRLRQDTEGRLRRLRNSDDGTDISL